MRIEIKHRESGKVLFASDDAPSLKEAITQGVEKKFAARRYSSNSEFLGGSYQTLDLSYADLRGADLSGAELGAATFSNADLSGADLSGAQTFITNFDHADLSNTNLSGTELDYTSLEGTNLHGAHFSPGYVAWQKHVIVAEILRQAAGDDAEKQEAVTQIPFFPYPPLKERNGASSQWGRIDWRTWKEGEYPLKEWALDALASYIVFAKVEMYLPDLLRDHVVRRIAGR